MIILENPSQYNDDLTELSKMLTEAGIHHELRKHPGAYHRVKQVLGYYPTGEWQILVKNHSVIRGKVSFGDYEIYNLETNDIDRVETAEEMLELINKL